MLIFQDKDGVICDAYENSTGRSDLTAVEVTDGTFDGWSLGKLKCFKCHVMPNGHVDTFSPAVDSRLIRNFDGTGAITMHKTAYLGDIEVIFTGVPKGTKNIGFDPAVAEYAVTEDGDNLTVSFSERNEVTEVKLTIM